VYKAKCSHEDCKYAAMDNSFDRVADALQDHHFNEHGVLTEGVEPLASKWETDVPKLRKKAAA
jgi:predicted small metal-binding protein